MRVALAQMEVVALDPKRNLERIAATLDELAVDRPDLVVFPELADLGQVTERDKAFGARYADAAEPVPGGFSDAIGALAVAHDCHIAVGVAERHPDIAGTIYNTALLVDPQGAVVGRQRKLHPAGEERHYFAAGAAVEVVSCDLGVVSLVVCYDAYFPEVPRAAALQGAELLCGLFNITHRPDWPHRLAQLAAVRAYENMQHVVFVNRVGTDHGRTFGGESAATTPPGLLLAEGPPAEEWHTTVDLDRERLLEARAERTVFADRRPDVYQLDQPSTTGRGGGREER